MLDLWLNLFTSVFNFSIKNRIFLAVIIFYELIPFLIFSSESINNKSETVNYINYIFKYLSLNFHIEVINSNFQNTCPFSNVTIPENLNFTEIFAETSLEKLVVSEVFPFVRLDKLVYLKDLSLDYLNCRTNEILFFICLVLFILLVLALILLVKNNTTKTRKGKYFKKFLSISTNYVYFMLRPCAQMFYLVFFNIIFYFMRFAGVQNFSFTTTDYFMLIISITILVMFTMINYLFIKNIRFYSDGFLYDCRSRSNELILLVVKIMMSVEISMRKFYMMDNITIRTLMIVTILTSAYFHEYFFNEYITNLRLNHLKLGTLFYCSFLTIIQYLNFYIGIETVTAIVLEYVVVLFLSVFLVYLKYQKCFTLNFITDTGKMMQENQLNKFIRQALRYTIEYEKDQRKMSVNKLKSSIEGNNLNKINENFNLLNSHFWNCQIKINNEMCPICKIHKKFVVNRLTQFKGKENLCNNNLMLEHLILKAIRKFVSFIEKKLLNNINETEINIGSKIIVSFDLITNLNIVDLFFLKTKVLRIIDTKLIRIIIYCTYMQHKYPRNFNIQLFSNFFKISIKNKQAEKFSEYDNLKIEDQCLTHFKNTLNLCDNFFQNLSINEIKYSTLLGKYLDLGCMHEKIKDNLNSLSKSLKPERRIDFITFLSTYKFIFNCSFDQYLHHLNDIDDNIKLLEFKYINDNILVLDFDLIENNFIIRKVPSNMQLRTIFTHEDIGTYFDRFFPRIMRKEEKDKMLKLVLKNKTNYFSISTYLLDKEMLLNKVNLKFKLFLTIESTFKIFVCLEIAEDNRCMILHKNGRFAEVSKEFMNSFLIQPVFFKNHPSLCIFQFFKDFTEEESACDLEDKKELVITINMKNYYEGFNKVLGEMEDLQEIIEDHEFQNKVFFKNSCQFDYKRKKTYLFKQLEKRVIDNDVVLFYEFIEQKIRKNEVTHKESTIVDEYDKLRNMYLNNKNNDDGFSIFYKSIDIDHELVYAESVTVSSSVSHTNKGKEENNLRVFYKQTQKYSEYKENSRKMTKYCYYIIIINALIVLVGILVLLLINYELESMFSSFSVIQGFTLESWMVQLNYLGILSLVTVKNEQNLFNPNDIVAMQKSPLYDQNYKLNIALHLKQELLKELDLLDNSTKTVHNAINNYFPEDFINNKIKLPCELFFFSQSNEGFTLSSTNLFDMLQLFKGFIFVISNDQKVASGIDLINMANNATYITQMNDYFLTTNSESEKNIAILIINYFKNIHSNINTVMENFFEFQETQNSNMDGLIYKGMIGLIFSDFVVLYLTFTLLVIYRNQVKLVMSVIYSLEKEILNDLIEKHKNINIFLNSLMSPVISLRKIKSLTKNRTTNSGIKRETTMRKLKIASHSEAEVLSASQFIQNDSFILQFFNKIFFSLAAVIIVFFTVGFVLISSQSQEINTRIKFNKNFVSELKFIIEELIILRTSLFLNKTNIYDDYFTQNIAADDFLDKSFNFGQNSKTIIQTTNEHKSNMPIMTNFLNTFRGENICTFLKTLHHNANININTNVASYNKELEDFESSFLYLCQNNKILQTDLFSVFEFINIKLREYTFRYVNGPKDLDSLKNLVDSKDIGEIILMEVVLLKPLMLYFITEILTPAYYNDLNKMLLIVIVILIMNIMLNFCFLLIKNSLILRKTVQNVDSLNILLKILS